MPMTSGPVAEHGPIVHAYVGVGPARRAILQRLGMAIPGPVVAPCVIDTGSFLTGFSADVFARLEVPPVGSIQMLTPSTRADEPVICELFDVSISVVANGSIHAVTSLRAVCTDGWHPEHEAGVIGLLGRDLLARTRFSYDGIGRTFSLTF